MIILRHNLIIALFLCWFSATSTRALHFGKNAGSFSRVEVDKTDRAKVVSQQSESSIFRAWLSGCALFV